MSRQLSEGHPEGRMRKLTLLDDATQGFGGAAPGAWVGETSRRQRLVGIPDPGGERRHLSGVGKGPTEAAAKQDARNGPTQAGVRNKMRNNDLRFGYGHASVTLRSTS
jgi:hypothetical protein